MKYADIAKAAKHLRALKETMFSNFNLTHGAYLFVSDVEKELEFYQNTERSLAIAYDATITEGTMKFKSPEQCRKCAAELDELKNKEVGIPKLNIYDSDIKSTRMTPEDMDALSGIVDFRRGYRE